MAKSNTCMLIILWVWSEGSRLKSPGNLKDNYNNNTVRPRSHGWLSVAVGLLYVVPLLMVLIDNIHIHGDIRTSQNIQYCER
jgi:hypothetical protein